MLKPLFESIDEVLDIFKTRKPAFFLDYDGTLTPIVSRPEDARISPEMKAAVRELAGKVPVAIVSGRDRHDAKNLVGIDDLIYAGSHGFDIDGPNINLDHPEAAELLPSLDHIEASLKDKTRTMAGISIERKKYSIAIHYRAVFEKNPDQAESIKSELEHIIDGEIAAIKGLRKTSGKMVFDLQPDLDWHKGRAVRFLIDSLNYGDHIPVYIGDDTTDEHALAEIKDKGIGILVSEEVRESHASYYVHSVDDVRKFLEKVAAIY